MTWGCRAPERRSVQSLAERSDLAWQRYCAHRTPANRRAWLEARDAHMDARTEQSAPWNEVAA